jgi:NADH dehydrogenase
MDEPAPDKNYVVIGAGPTGVELSAALTSYMKDVVRKHGLRRRRINVNLIEAAPRVLPASSLRISQKTVQHLRKLGVKVLLNKKVEGETGDQLVISGKTIPTRTVIWTAGVTNNPFFAANKSAFTLNDHSKVVVNDHLRVDENVYVIGDNADTPHSGLGLTAVHNARYVSKDIKKRLAGIEITPAYKPMTPATAVPVGPHWGIFQYRNIILWGIPAAILRSLADLVAYNDIVGPIKAIKIWLRSDSREEICTVCQTALEKEHHGPLLQPH